MNHPVICIYANASTPASGRELKKELPKVGQVVDVPKAVAFHTNGHARNFLAVLRKAFAHLRPGKVKKVRYPLAESGTVLRVRKDESGALIVTEPKTKRAILVSTPDRLTVAVFLGRAVDPVNPGRTVFRYLNDSQ